MPKNIKSQNKTSVKSNHIQKVFLWTLIPVICIGIGMSIYSYFLTPVDVNMVTTGDGGISGRSNSKKYCSVYMGRTCYKKGLTCEETKYGGECKTVAKADKERKDALARKNCIQNAKQYVTSVCDAKYLGNAKYDSSTSTGWSEGYQICAVDEVNDIYLKCLSDAGLSF